MFHRNKPAFFRNIISQFSSYFGIACLTFLVLCSYIVVKNAVIMRRKGFSNFEVIKPTDPHDVNTNRRENAKRPKMPEDTAAFFQSRSKVRKFHFFQRPRPSQLVERAVRIVDQAKPGSDAYYSIQGQLNSIVNVNKTAYKSRTCSAVTGRRIVINYAHKCCAYSQPLNCKTALKNGFDICIQFTKRSIDRLFLERNSKIFAHGTMAGFGVWKPYLIMRVLMTLDDGDVLFYSDSGAMFVAPAEDHFCLMNQRKQSVVVFSVGLPENEYTKGDALLLTGCSTEECQYSQQRLGGYSIYRKSMEAFNFLSTWLTYNQDLRIVSNSPSFLQNDLPNFQVNRHDQSALSLASKRCGIPEWPDPSQWGENGWNRMLREKPEFRKIAKTIINCTRDKS